MYKKGEVVQGWKILDIVSKDVNVANYKVQCPYCPSIRHKTASELNINISCGCLNVNNLTKDQIVNGWKVMDKISDSNQYQVQCPFCPELRIKTYSQMNNTISCGCKLSELKGKKPGEQVGGWTIIENVQNQVGRYVVQCPHCSNIRNKQHSDLIRCRSCGCLSITTLEEAFITLMSSHFPDIEKYDRPPIEFSTKRRPDFRLEANGKILYVNLDGLAYHSMEGLRVDLKRNYHLALRDLFNDNQVNIFQFREDEIRYKSEIVKSIVLNYFGFSTKIYARKCKIAILTTLQAQVFYQENHLMGYIPAKSYGLFYEDQLIAAISTKFKQSTLEISRFCTKKNYSIVGGFSKLLNYVIKLYTPQKVTSFLDLRYSLGQSYRKLGFIQEKISLGWRWTDFHETFNRLKCTANMDSRGLTEAEHAKELGWYKIYDAGQAKFILDLR
jgi:hypothetical protein